MKTCSERLMKYKRAKKQAFDKGFREIYQMKPNVSKIKDPEVKAKWVTALRSGNYKQGEGRLRSQSWIGTGWGQPEFCCLGVLCDILKPSGWCLNNTEHSFSEGKSRQRNYPNEKVMKELGIYPSAMKKLGSLNDDDRLDFNKIADYIEKTL
jgi:hypothetical protein